VERGSQVYLGCMLTPEEVEEQVQCLHLERWTLQPFPIADWDDEDGSPVSTRLAKVNTDARATIADQFSVYYHRETSYDHPPFELKRWREEHVETFLIVSAGFLSLAPIASGAAGLFRVQDAWILHWAWLHPFERALEGRDTWDAAWKALEALHPGLLIEAPLSRPMRAWVKRQGLEERVVSVRPVDG